MLSTGSWLLDGLIGLGVAVAFVELWRTRRAAEQLGDILHRIELHVEATRAKLDPTYSRFPFPKPTAAETAEWKRRQEARQKADEEAGKRIEQAREEHHRFVQD